MGDTANTERAVAVGDFVETCGLSAAQNGLRGRVEEKGSELKVKLTSGEVLAFRAANLKRLDPPATERMSSVAADASSKFSFRRAGKSKKDSPLSFWVTIIASATDPTSPEDYQIMKGCLELNVAAHKLSIMTITGRERHTVEYPVAHCSLLNEKGRLDVSPNDIEDEKQLDGLSSELLRIKLMGGGSQSFAFDDDASLAHFLRAWPGPKPKSFVTQEPATPELQPRGLAPDTKGNVKLDEADQKAVSSTHHAFELTYDMMLGIRTTVSRIEAKKRSDLTMQDMATTTRLRFPAKGSRNTPAHGMSDFYFKDYAPEVFRRIRGLAGIDPGNYLNEVCGDFQFLEFQSNSKSGEFFFFSHNRHYMIKTISHPETIILQAMLPSYYVHLQNNHDSLLTQFYGMHKVRPANQTKPYYFLIMKSIFHTDLPIHAIFDLKGSSLGRSASQADKDRGDCVYKDNDFLEQQISLQLGPERARRLVNAVEKDVNLLRDMNIMDYSLLIGVHYSSKHPKNKGNQRRSISVNQLSHMRNVVADEDDDGLNLEVERNRTPTIVRGSIRPVDLGFSKLALPDLPLSVAASEGEDDPSRASVDSERKSSPDGGESATKKQEDSATFVAARRDHRVVPTAKQEKKSARQIKNEAILVTPQADATVVRSVWQETNGGCAGSGMQGENEVYFFGIIDILVEYGIKKKMETKFKSMKHDKATISSVEPVYYANRFTQFVKSNVVNLKDQ